MTEPTQAPPSPPPTSSGWTAPPSRPRTAGQGFNLQDFLYFRYLITPPSMTVIYIFGAVAVTFGAIATMGSSVLFGLLILVFGNLYWRIILEFVMVLFRINDSLQSIDRRGKGM